MYGLELVISKPFHSKNIAVSNTSLHASVVGPPARLVINGTFAQTLCGESGAVNIIGTVRAIFAGIVWSYPSLNLTLAHRMALPDWYWNRW